MAIKNNDLLEQENQTLETSASADYGIELSAADTSLTATSDDNESNIDLNELLGAMDITDGDTQDKTDAQAENSAVADEAESDDEAVSTEQTGNSASEEPTPGAKPAKTRRGVRKKKAAETSAPVSDMSPIMEGTPNYSEDATVSTVEAPPLLNTSEDSQLNISDALSTPGNMDTPVRSNAPVLTIRSREDVTTEEEREDIIWHEIRNAYRTRRILTGKLGGIEQTDSKKTIAIVDYKGFRIIIPLKEMMIQLPRTSTEQEYSELMLRQNKILNNMLGADIDFIVRGIDSKTFSVVASRREAMLRKRQLFYLDTDSSGTYRIYEGRIVQSRVIAVAEKVIRVEIFGVETSIMARDLAWDWIGDAHERFSVGDEVLVRVQKVRRESLEDISVRVDVKSISQNTSQDNLQKCRVQSKYMGKVTDVHKGVVYIRLSNGVNAIAHSCYDYRTPGKKDDVSFAVTRLDMERGVAVGIITRIIRQNL